MHDSKYYILQCSKNVLKMAKHLAKEISLQNPSQIVKRIVIF